MQTQVRHTETGALGLADTDITPPRPFDGDLAPQGWRHVQFLDGLDCFVPVQLLEEVTIRSRTTWLGETVLTLRAKDVQVGDWLLDGSAGWTVTATEDTGRGVVITTRFRVQSFDANRELEVIR